MKKIFSFVTLTAFAATLLTGCASYRATSLESLPFTTSKSLNAPSGVAVAAKALSKDECKRFLGRDVIKVGIQPIQLTIRNNSNNPLIFSLNRISLPCIDPLDVANKVHTSTAGRAVGYGAAAVFICPLFIIPAVYDGFKSSEANEKLDDDFWGKGAKDQRIEPRSHSNMLVFVNTSVSQQNFDLTLVDAENNQFQQFSVDIA